MMIQVDDAALVADEEILGHRGSSSDISSSILHAQTLSRLYVLLPWAFELNGQFAMPMIRMTSPSPTLIGMPLLIRLRALFIT